MRNLFRSLVLVTVLLCFWVLRQQPDGKLHVIFCDVGQGDANLVIKGSLDVLIDTGPVNGGVISCLGKHLPFWDRQIEVVFLTHPQSDHMGDLMAVLSRYQIGALVVNGEEVTGEKAKEAMSMAKERKIKIVTARLGDEFHDGDLFFDVVWPEVVEGNGNMDALVLLLREYGFRVLFTSDIGTNEELALEDESVLGKVNILKVAHHGSKFSSAQEFIESIRPEWAVVSVGAKNSYGHPAAEVLRRFEALGAHVWRTDKLGEAEFVSDGKRYWVLE